MNIFALLKLVPDTVEELEIGGDGKSLDADVLRFKASDPDEHAVEQAILLKEKHGGTVTVVTMGPPQAAEALKTCVAMGVDHTYLVSDRAFAGSDTWATSYTLSQAIKKIGKFDLILCGKQAIDGDTAQVGPGIAEWLGLPQVTFVSKITMEGDKLKIERLLEEVNEVVECPLPAVLTVVKQINEPRLPSLKGLMRAKKAEIKSLNAADIEGDPKNMGLNGSPTSVVRIFTPPAKGGGQILSGEPEAIIDTLIGKLKERKTI